MRRARQRWADEARPRYAAIVAAWAARDKSGTPATQLLDGASEIAQAAADHYLTIQSGILPAAYSSEMLFGAFYNKLVKRKNDPPPLTFLLGYDSEPIHTGCMNRGILPVTPLRETPAVKHGDAKSAVCGHGVWKFAGADYKGRRTK